MAEQYRFRIDAPVLWNLADGSRARNQSYMSNITYGLSPNVAFALEWQRFLTNCLSQPLTNNKGDHFNLAAADTF